LIESQLCRGRVEVFTRNRSQREEEKAFPADHGRGQISAIQSVAAVHSSSSPRLVFKTTHGCEESSVIF
jgi:hypothetical protein